MSEREFSYHWKPGARVAGVRPEVAGAAFDAIEQRDGYLSPEAIREAARPEKAPLHPALNWDDADAAERYRLQQAGGLIRSLVIVRHVSDAPPSTPVRAFVRVISSEPVDSDSSMDPAMLESGHYTSIRRVVVQPDARALLLRRACEELQAWQRRYRELSEFAALFEAIERIAEATQLAVT